MSNNNNLTTEGENSKEDVNAFVYSLDYLKKYNPNYLYHLK